MAARFAAGSLLHAAPFVGDGRVCIGGVAERVGRHRRVFLSAVLDTVRRGDFGVERRKRREKALLFPLEQGLIFGQFENRRHEVVLARAFFETSNQVCDGDVEFGGVNDGRV